MKIVIFLDYDNLDESQKVSGIFDVVTRALMLVPWDHVATRGTCDVRIYGGWYEGAVMTQRAQDVSVEIQNVFPAIIRVYALQGHLIGLTANAELAVSLIEEPAHLLFNTYRKKGKPKNIRVQLPASVGCSDVSCLLPLAKKLLKSGKCPIATCRVTSADLVYRDEQKIVDTMLACDLIYTTAIGYDRVILIGGDDDFLPPLRTALLRGATVVRIHTEHNNQRAIFPAGSAQLLEIDL